MRDECGWNAGKRYGMRRGRMVVSRSGKQRRRYVGRFTEFNEENMKRIKDVVRRLVPEVVSLGLGSISNENARE